MGGGGSVEFPFTKHVSPRHGWSREVCEPIPIPGWYTHTTHPPTNQPHLLPIPHPPLGANDPCPTPPPPPPTQPPIHAPQPPNHSSTNPTNPKHIYIMPNEFTYYSSTSFQDSKLMRVIWQYQNYGIPNFSYA